MHGRRSSLYTRRSRPTPHWHLANRRFGRSPRFRRVPSPFNMRLGNRLALRRHPFPTLAPILCLAPATAFVRSSRAIRPGIPRARRIDQFPEPSGNAPISQTTLPKGVQPSETALIGERSPNLIQAECRLDFTRVWLVHPLSTFEHRIIFTDPLTC